MQQANERPRGLRAGSVIRLLENGTHESRGGQAGGAPPSEGRERRFAWLRVALGALWLIDGLFKWQPDVLGSFLDIVRSVAKGQPGPIHALLQWNAQLLAHAPQLAGRAVGTGEILVGCLLILGIGSRFALLGSMVLALLIWAFGEGFGQIFTGTATDIGASPLYLLLALAIYLGQGWTTLTILRPIRARVQNR